jgi:hypothetical protein
VILSAALDALAEIETELATPVLAQDIASGIAINKDGKRIDPSDFYEQPSALTAEQWKILANMVAIEVDVIGMCLDDKHNDIDDLNKVQRIMDIIGPDGCNMLTLSNSERAELESLRAENAQLRLESCKSCLSEIERLEAENARYRIGLESVRVYLSSRIKQGHLLSDPNLKAASITVKYALNPKDQPNEKA